MKRLLLLMLNTFMIFSLISFALGAEHIFVANLSGDQEVSPVETQGLGQAIFHLSEDGAALTYKITISNVENITMSHIHIAPAGQDGPPIVWLYPDEPPSVLIPGVFNGILAEGTITESDLIGDLAGQQLSSLLQTIEAGNAYVNVHTELYPGGEVRGQIMAAPITMFEVMIENISDTPEFSSSGVFNTPDGAAGPGPLPSGSAYKLTLGAAPGSKLSFATMFVQSNDLFYAPGESGIPLFNADGTPVSGDVAAQVMLWDAGTEVNQEPGIGLDQPPRQAGPNTGADENGVVQPVNDGYTYPDVASSLSVTITPGADNEFEVSIENTSVAPEFSSSGIFNTPIGNGNFTVDMVNIAFVPETLTIETGDTVTWSNQDSVPHTVTGFGDDVNVPPGETFSHTFNEPGTFDYVCTIHPEMSGPLSPGSAYIFNVSGAPGSKLSFATMFVQSNDLFYAPGEPGISLFDADGMPISGDVTDQVMLWDVGTEVNQEPGVGADQAPRQAGPNTGEDENGVVQPVSDDYTYPAISDVLSITVTPTSDTEFTVSIENISSDATFLLAPGVWAVHTEDAPLFTSGQPDPGEGLEALAEDGDPSILASAFESRTGVPVILAPGVWVVHTEDAPLFTSGQPDRGEGLEALAEDGDPSVLASALGSRTGVSVILAPGAWAVHTEDAPLFTSGQPDRGEGLEELAEDGDPSDLEAALESKVGVVSSGIFNTPAGAGDAGPVVPGASYEFQFSAFPGSELSFATMFVQSNDLFYAPDEAGIALFGAYGGAVSGDVTSEVMLWDAGTEVNQRPGVGPDQAPRQAGPNTGADENGNVGLVSDGYTYPDVSESIRVTITVLPPEEPARDYSNVFLMNLSAGLNMVSLPLQPIEAYTARAFAEAVESTVVIKYDTEAGRFFAFTQSMEGDGFIIEGGQGYIVNRMTGGAVTFAGAAWENEPSTDAAPPLAERNSAWAFVVTGKLDSVADYTSGSYTITVRNLRTGDSATDPVSGTGSFAAVFADLARNPVVEKSDPLEITVTDSAGDIVSGPVVHRIVGNEIQRAFADIILPFGRMAPEKTVLLQNYPNPFNPETWIPYQLAEAARVSVRIHDSAGRLVRLLDLGHRDAGSYTQRHEAAYWDGRNNEGEYVSSGVYFYTMQAGSSKLTRKMTILK
jgi:plastocyanin